MDQRVPEQESWDSVLRWTAWVANGADAVMVSSALQHVLIGRRLTAVRYADLDYDSMIPYWHEGDRDSIGHGVELDFSDGSTWSIIWEQRGGHSGLGVWRGPLIPGHLQLAQIWDVTHRWYRRGPRTITDVQVFWRPSRPACWEGGPRGHLNLGGLILHDRSRDRQAILAIDHAFDVNIYFSQTKARHAGYFDESYIDFGR